MYTVLTRQRCDNRLSMLTVAVPRETVPVCNYKAMERAAIDRKLVTTRDPIARIEFALQTS